MDVIKIKGGKPLYGTLKVSGAKNAALPIFAATLLTEETCIIENVPDLSDIRFMAEILRHLGAEVERLDTNTWKITAAKIKHIAPYELVRKMRASICLLGPIIARMRKAEISMPGGCVIGPRPIDLHLKGLAKIGCDISVKNGYIFVDAKNIHGGQVFLGGRHGSTVTGTANIVMAAVLTPGTTYIESAACEPEVVDLCLMLKSMGADIEGIGSHSLTINGVEKLSGTQYKVLPDRIEAGTFMIAAAMTGGDVTIEGMNLRDMGALLDKFEQTEIPLEIVSDHSVRIKTEAIRNKLPVDIITLPHPGFPTDLQAQYCALLTTVPGLSIITERVYPNRFMHVPELQRMGADIAIEGPSAIIKGTSKLSGAPVMASDLRASAALVLAGLAAEGETWVQRIYHLDRGYEKLVEKFQQIGADITRMPAEQMPQHLLSE